jgi:lysophospholipase L1-like esterase
VSLPARTAFPGLPRRLDSLGSIPTRLVPVVALALVALALVVRNAPASTSAAPKPLDRRLLIVGDSVMLGAHEELAARLGATGWQVTPILAESLHTYDAPALVDDNRQAVGDVVVIGLGTNDGQTPGQFAGWIDGLMEHLRGVKRVFWVNLPEFADWVPAANAEITAARQRWRHLRVIDWGARAAQDPSLRYGDGIHLTAAGRAAIADLVGATLDDYAGVTPPTTTAGPPPSAAVTTVASTVPPTTRARAGRASDEDDDTFALIALCAIAALGAGLLAVGWARRPRGQPGPSGRRRPPQPRRRRDDRPPMRRRPPVSRPPRVHRAR